MLPAAAFLGQAHAHGHAAVAGVAGGNETAGLTLAAPAIKKALGSELFFAGLGGGGVDCGQFGIDLGSAGRVGFLWIPATTARSSGLAAASIIASTADGIGSANAGVARKARASGRKLLMLLSPHG
jgi:hypothetical protein